MEYSVKSRPITAAPSKVRTPRLYSNKSKRIQPKLGTLHSVTSNQVNENYSPIMVEQTFKAFIDAVVKVINLNWPSQFNRNSFVNYTTEAQHLFPSLLSALQCDNLTSSLIAGVDNYSTIAGPLPFLKLWKAYAKMCCDLQFNTPEYAKQSLIRNFEIINTSINFISKVQAAQNGIQKDIQVILQQKITLQTESFAYIAKSNDMAMLKDITHKIKAYSKILNDYFLKEFNECGISTKDLVRIRQKLYTTCSDIISILNSYSSMEDDVKNMINYLDKFQDALSAALNHADLPQTAIYKRPALPEFQEEINHPTTPNSELEIVEYNFQNCKNPEDLANYGLENPGLFNNSEQTTNYLNYMKELVKHLREEHKLALEAQHRAMKDLELKSQTELLKSETKRKELIKKLESLENDHSSEIKVLRDIISRCHLFFHATHISEETKNNELNDIIEKSINDFQKLLTDKDSNLMKMFDEYVKVEENHDIYSYMVQVKQHLSKQFDEMKSLQDEFNNIQVPDTDFYIKKIAELQIERDGLISQLSTKLSDLYNGISEKFGDFISVPNTGSFFEDSIESCDLMVHALKKEKERNTKLEKLNSHIRDRLAKHLQVEVPVGDFDESSLKLIEMLEKMQNPLQKELNSAEELVSILTKTLTQIRTKLKIENGDNVYKGHVLANVVMKDVTAFADNVDQLKKSFLAYREIIIKYNDKAGQMVGIDITNEHYHNLSDADFISFSNRLVNGMIILHPTKPKVEKPNQSLDGVNKIFAEVFKQVDLENKTQPMVYLPEIATIILTMNHTITALKPFANILNDIFSQFDCKLKTFSPGSAQYKLLRQNIMKIHAALSSIVPSKINSIVFLVLSRFVALLSSLLSALSSLSYAESDIDSKEEIFNIQQENIRLNNMLNEQNNVK